MIELLMRRREMGAHKKEPFVIPYITDGLVFYLDGIEQGNTSGAWTDLVGGIVFTKKAGTVTFNSDNVQFNGSSNNCLVSSIDGSGAIPSSVSATIEVCYNNTSGKTNKSLFYGGYFNPGLSFHINNTTDIVWGAGNSQKPARGYHTNQAKTTYSISRARAFENFEEKTFGSGSYVSLGSTYIIVGGSGRSASTFYDVFEGKIHAIRIYNRQLTEEEVLANQAVDNTRFNLGLTINT